MIRRISVILIEAAAFLFGALLILAVVLVWRLSQGPVDVRFLTPYIERAAVDDPYRLSIGNTELRWAGFDSPVTLAATNVAVLEVEERGGARRSIARFPEIEIAVAWPPLLSGRIVPTRLSLAEPRLWARLDEQGGLGFGFSADETSDDMPTDASEMGDIMGILMSQLMASPQEGGRAVLTEVEISDGRLIIVDEQRDVIWRGTGVSGNAIRQLNAVSGVFEASLEASTAGSVGFAQGSFSYGLTDGASDVQLILDEIDVNSLADVLLPDQTLPSIDVPVKGVLAGVVAPGLQLTDVTFDIRAESGSITAEDVLLRPLAFDRIGAAGHFSPPDQRLDIDSITLQADPLDAGVSGSFAREGDAWNLAASISAKNLPVDRFEVYWPKVVLPSVRNWVVVKTFGGMIETLDVAGQMRFTKEETWSRELVSLDGEFSGSGLNLNPLHGLPPLRELEGTGRFDTTGLYITSPSAKSLDAQLSEGRISVTGFGTPSPDVDIEFVVAGSLATGLYYLNRPRLKLIDQLGIPADRSDGRVAGRVRLRFPIVPGLSLDDVSAIAAANIRDGSIQLNPQWRLEGTSATLSVDQASVNLDGNGDLSGVPVSFSARRLIRSDEQFDTRVRFDALIEADRLSDFGLPPIPSLFGPIDIAVSLQEGNNRQVVELEADLAEAGLAVPQIDWAKPVGEPGTLTGTIRLDDWEPVEISDFAFSGAGLDLGGLAAFVRAPDDGRAVLGSLDVNRLTLGDNDLQGTVVRREDGNGWHVIVSGKSLSLRPLLRRVGGGGVAGGGAGDDRRLTDLPVSVEAQIDRVIVGDDRLLEQARGTFIHDGERWVSVELSGMAFDVEREEETSISARYTHELTDDRNFWVSTGNFGAALNALNITDQVLGGEMALSARLAIDDEPPFKPSDPAMQGEVKMTSYSVIRAPAIAQLLVALSLNGLRGTLDEEGILFNGLEADFVFDDGILTVANGETGGSGLGLTLEGTLDTNESAINMDGTIVPIRGINRLLNQVPVLGELLGGKDEGLFAFTYRLTGPLDEPKADVNPISVLAPGALREIFRFGSSPQEEREEREAAGESG